MSLDYILFLLILDVNNTICVNVMKKNIKTKYVETFAFVQTKMYYKYYLYAKLSKNLLRLLLNYKIKPILPNFTDNIGLYLLLLIPYIILKNSTKLLVT
jgi:hypothetical protein